MFAIFLLSIVSLVTATCCNSPSTIATAICFGLGFGCCYSGLTADQCGTGVFDASARDCCHTNAFSCSAYFDANSATQTCQNGVGQLNRAAGCCQLSNGICVSLMKAADCAFGNGTYDSVHRSCCTSKTAQCTSYFLIETSGGLGSETCHNQNKK